MRKRKGADNVSSRSFLIQRILRSNADLKFEAKFDLRELERLLTSTKEKVETGKC